MKLWSYFILLLRYISFSIETEYCHVGTRLRSRFGFRVIFAHLFHCKVMHWFFRRLEVVFPLTPIFLLLFSYFNKIPQPPTSFSCDLVFAAHSVFWEENHRLKRITLWGWPATRNFPKTVWSPEVRSRVHKSPPLFLILSQNNPIHSTPASPSKTHFNIIHIHMFSSSWWSPSFWLSYNILHSFQLSPTRAKCLAHFIVLDLIILIILGEDYALPYTVLLQIKAMYICANSHNFIE
jgi:hypothetical protein